MNDGKPKWYADRRYSVVDEEVYSSLTTTPSSRGRKSQSKSRLSKALIVYFHGGGFIAMSSFSHEMYTRKWAVDTGMLQF